MNKKQVIGWVLAVSAINWGLTLFNINLVEMFLGGPSSILTKLVYALIGLVGVYKAYWLFTGGKK